MVSVDHFFTLRLTVVARAMAQNPRPSSEQGDTLASSGLVRVPWGGGVYSRKCTLTPQVLSALFNWQLSSTPVLREIKLCHTNEYT